MAGVQFGYKLMSETTGPRELVRNAKLAEEAGFDFVGLSDHYLPWLESHGHSPFAWSVLGAIAETTERVGIATGLTCPIIRYHPTIIAQAAATIGVMSEGRFTLALGAGERLNEHIVGYGWPPVHQRHEMLREAVEIMRRLWEGELYSHSGEYYEVESARIYDLPEEPVPIVIGISGKKSATLAGELGVGIMAVEPEPSLIKDWKAAGGEGSRYIELSFAYASSEKEGLKIAHEYSKFGALGWEVLAELPGVKGFEGATKYIKPEDLKDSIPHGPDPAPYIEHIKKAIDAGFDRVVLLGAGPDQAGFIRFFEKTLAPELRGLTQKGQSAKKKKK
ncbi:TIGR03557 family F420-dependent LLM class oxidoreductase [Steroidobacter flavus]|uniref:TIGR03557 family F420-dependent LLM class oxidoreductase n=1 Tax=Steroidobacter flavus TaxID=1842136 RepID=A0ABV8SLW5_9GAMM